MELEEMAAFFEARLDGYDEHMLTNIESAEEFYPYTAAQLPVKEGAKLLDLGCGTGLELEYYFKLNPAAEVVGIDLSAGMLTALKEKFPDRVLTLIQGSYFTISLGDRYDAVVSVESLHHFTREEKLPLYKRVRDALDDGGYFVLTDYMVTDETIERELRSEYERLKTEAKLPDGAFYHFDTPLTVEHECAILRDAGFAQVEVLKHWGNTYCMMARKQNLPLNEEISI